jgi:AcrR family transcriptional regulator
MAGRDSERESREQRILDAAAELIVRHGYDKTTMAEVADQAGVSRGIVYLHFRGKDELFEALLAREFPLYAQAWLEHLEADPRGGTIGGLVRGTIAAINSRPLMAAMNRRDRRILGSYLRRPNNILASLQVGSTSGRLVRAMQEAGAVRKDIDAAVIAHILDTLFLGLVSADDTPGREEVPPFDDLLEAAGVMLDRALTPEGGGDAEAGKAVIRQLADWAREQFEQERRR